MGSWDEITLLMWNNPTYIGVISPHHSWCELSQGLPQNSMIHWAPQPLIVNHWLRYLSLKTNSSHLQMDIWKTSFLLWDGLCSGVFAFFLLLVFREHISLCAERWSWQTPKSLSKIGQVHWFSFTLNSDRSLDSLLFFWGMKSYPVI